MNYELFREEYNEVMFDERDAIEDFLKEISEVYHKESCSWDLNPRQALLLRNGRYVDIARLHLDDEKFVVFESADGEDYECDRFFYGELSKIIESLPDVNKIKNLHCSENYQTIMSLLENEENLLFGLKERGLDGEVEFHITGMNCNFVVLSVYRDDSKLYISGELRNNDNLLCNVILEEKDIEPGYLVDLIKLIQKQQISPEERLALTDEQKEILKRIKKDMNDFAKAGGTVMLDHDYGTLFVVNTNGIELNCYGSDSDHKEFVDIEKLPQENVIGNGYVCYTSEGIYINS